MWIRNNNNIIIRDERRRNAEDACTRRTVCYRFEICATGDAILFPVSLRRRRTIRSPDAAIGSIGFGRSAQQGCAALRSFAALLDHYINGRYLSVRPRPPFCTVMQKRSGPRRSVLPCRSFYGNHITVGGTRFITSCEYIIL